ncbi:MAG: 1-acyl-sn-glycerol-3-phosphate acyltransferase [Acidaminococcaceae bacterium]|nr:1-acyl-sn-glycerol-3-phosphate acyltransferase [Acidaminococcaceae bacterium]
MWYSFVGFIFHVIFKIIFRLEVIGVENIPKTGPVVIASNHASLLDPPLVGSSSSRKVYFMAKEELFVPVFRSTLCVFGSFSRKKGRG